MRKPREKTEYEACIMCGCITDIPISLPIDYRNNYVVGIGQLCEKCQNELDLETEESHGLSQDAISFLLESCRKESGNK